MADGRSGSISFSSAPCANPDVIWSSYQAEAVADKSGQEIDPTLAEAHTALATVSWGYDWDWQAADKEYRKALELIHLVSLPICANYD